MVRLLNNNLELDEFLDVRRRINTALGDPSEERYVHDVKVSAQDFLHKPLIEGEVEVRKHKLRPVPKEPIGEEKARENALAREEEYLLAKNGQEAFRNVWAEDLLPGLPDVSVLSEEEVRHYLVWLLTTYEKCRFPADGKVTELPESWYKYYDAIETIVEVLDPTPSREVKNDE